MGVFSSWSYQSLVTFWEPTLDLFSQPTWSMPIVFRCSYKRGGDLMIDDHAEQFSPRTRVWLEASDAEAPRVGWKMKIGNVAGSAPPADAETVRMIVVHDSSTFDEGTPDIVIATI